MQPLARQGYTDQQITALLKADLLAVDAGLELLDRNLNVVADISDALQEAGSERNMDARIHGTCRLKLTRRLAWGTDLVRGYTVLSDGQTTARFNQGVYSLTTPERVAGEDIETYEVEGYDRLYLLDREVGASYEASGGYLDAIRAAITAAGLTGVLLDSAAQAAVLPQPRVWPLFPASTDDGSGPTTWLRIVNDLLAAINYRGIYCDEDGRYRSEPYVAPKDRPAEFTFATIDVDEDTILGEQRTLVEDQWKARNRWVFIQQNIPGDPPPEPVNGAGRYEVVNQSDGPSSIDQRGLVWTRTEKLDAADQASLVAQGDRIVAADRRVSRAFKVTTGPFPAAGHYDVLAYHDDDLGIDVKVQAQQWAQDWFGLDTSWTWEAV